MINELNVLRAKIDEIDKSLLDLLVKRLSLVAQVGEIKSQYGLFIYAPDREEVMLASLRKEAISLGVSPDLIEDVLRRVMRESYYSENEKGFKTLRPQLRPVVIIGGRGQMGSLFNKMLTLSGYQVRILEKEDWELVDAILPDAGMVLISVPMNLTIEVIERLPRLLDDCILVDMSSVSYLSLQTMLSVHRGPVLGLHPMFSPDNGSMVKQNIVYCEGRYPESYKWLLEQIQVWGARLYRSDPIDHDHNMSFIQALYNFITFTYGVNFVEENVDVETILSLSSPMFRLQLIMIGRFFAKDPQFYIDIIMSSEEDIKLIRRYHQRFGEIVMLLEPNSRQKFVDRFEMIKNWFGKYADEFLSESCIILRQVNDNRK